MISEKLGAEGQYPPRFCGSLRSGSPFQRWGPPCAAPGRAVQADVVAGLSTKSGWHRAGTPSDSSTSAAIVSGSDLFHSETVAGQIMTENRQILYFMRTEGKNKKKCFRVNTCQVGNDGGSGSSHVKHSDLFGFLLFIDLEDGTWWLKWNPITLKLESLSFNY